MKNLGFKTRPWAAVRLGLSKYDWGGNFVNVRKRVLREHANKDWCIPVMRNGSVCDFAPADYHDVYLMMRRFLILTLKLPLELVDDLTLHSWRHWIPTVSAQQLINQGDANVLGHWQPGSAQPLHYDSAACCRELALKQQILRAYEHGWKRVGDFEIPVEVPKSADNIEPPDGADDVIDADDDPKKPQYEDFVFLKHPSSGKVHAFMTSSERAKCSWFPSGELRRGASSYPSGDDLVEYCAKCFSAEFKIWAMDQPIDPEGGETPWDSSDSEDSE
jgi:hypothetical protein